MKKRLGLPMIDRVLLVLLVAGILLGVWFVRRRYSAAEPTEEIVYVLSIAGIDEDLLGGTAREALIPIGGVITSSNGTAELGRVTAVQVLPHYVATVREGEVVFAELPGRFDLVVEAMGEGIFHPGDGIRIKDLRMAAGARGDYRIAGFYAAGADLISVKRENAS